MNLISCIVIETQCKITVYFCDRVFKYQLSFFFFYFMNRFKLLCNLIVSLMLMITNLFQINNAEDDDEEDNAD